MTGVRIRAVALKSAMAGVLTMAGCLAMAGSAPGSGASEVPLSRGVGASEAAISESYWTPERMEQATPEDPKVPGESEPNGMRRSGVWGAAVFHGVPTIGALFFRNGSGDHYCTASVINSRKRNLLLTAAHCIHGGRSGGYVSNVAFVPKYDGGRRPYGIWTARLLVVKRGWTHDSDPDLDFGFVVVNSRGGRRIANVVGSNRLVINRGFGRIVNVAGYPAGKDRPIYCRGIARKQASRQLRFDCPGFTGGTSGSPWLLSFNSKTRTGDTNGVIGGYQRGGRYSNVSYSPYFGDEVWSLRAFADDLA